MIQWLQKRWVYHSLSWITFIILFSLIPSTRASNFTFLELMQFVLQIFGPMFVVIYLHFFIIKQYFRKRRYLIYIALLLLVILTGLGVSNILEIVIGITETPISQEVVNICSILMMTTGLQYFKRGIISQYQLQELKAKNVEMELSTLKRQLNPHFLFNTLNNIYALNQRNSEKGSEMILELSEVMRYHLQMSKRKMVSLEEEIQLLHAYIELERLRLNDNCDLDIQLEEQNLNQRIAPLLLIPFLENAFKHGTHPVKPCFIRIKLYLEGNTLHYLVENSIIENSKTVKTNIGLENTMKRLELIYPNQHEIAIQEKTDTFQVVLKVEL